jgi:putative oxidoreductase
VAPGVVYEDLHRAAAHLRRAPRAAAARLRTTVRRTVLERPAAPLFIACRGHIMANLRQLMFLPGNARYADLGLLALSVLTGAFLIFQSHDNVLSAARMDEFEKFMVQFGFVHPELLAPLSVYAQFVAGIGFMLGAFTRWLGLITAFNFIVAVWMVRWNDPVPRIWPAAVLIVLGLYFGLRGSGRFGLDALFEGRRARP